MSCCARRGRHYRERPGHAARALGSHGLGTCPAGTTARLARRTRPARHAARGGRRAALPVRERRCGHRSCAQWKWERKRKWERHEAKGVPLGSRADADRAVASKARRTRTR